MKLIEITKGEFINMDSICHVSVNTQECFGTRSLGGGMQSSPKKISENTTIKITTSDGKECDVEECFIDSVYNSLFSIISE